ncbi:hypothetical protein KI387_020345 [Taxus chinensis]|uniref:Uncharacterized protein n=1 Tax=Taxus chinensis TaxID=29808 RepID=A0AA38LC69_TAXCH|nr:hypothetical protein KI387_020345 [Taxus chinensis]
MNTNEDAILSDLEGFDDIEEPIEIVSTTPPSCIFFHEESLVIKSSFELEKESNMKLFAKDEVANVADQSTNIQYEQERALSTLNDEIIQKEEGQIRKINLSVMRRPCPIRYLASLEPHTELPSIVLISEHKKELQVVKNQPQHLQRQNLDFTEVFILFWVDILGNQWCTPFLVVLDIKKEMRKWANWLPGKGLILSALTIQALSFFSWINIRISPNIDEDVTIDDLIMKYVTHLVIVDAITLNMIVFLGFFLPAMLTPRSLNNFTGTATLAICIFFPLENLFSKEKNPPVNEVVLYKEISLLCIIFLIFLLGRTVLASQTTRHIMSQSISVVLAAEYFGISSKTAKTAEIL